MKTYMLGIVCGVSLLVCANALAWQDVPGKPDPNGGTDVSAVDLVQQALQAEAENNPARRAALLGEALRKDPECAPARWQSGYVRVDDRWLTLAEAQSKFAADPQLTEYRQVRESLAESPVRELLLARWCDEKKLADEGRFHWLNVLRIEPLNQAALKALGVQWYNGLLLTRDQVAEQKRKDFKASRDTMNRRSAQRPPVGIKNRELGTRRRPGRQQLAGHDGSGPGGGEVARCHLDTEHVAGPARPGSQGSGSVPSGESELACPPGERPCQHEIRGDARHRPPC